MKQPVFIDRAKLKASAGKGGNGVATFRREKFIPFGGPSGGDGGRGGDVIVEASKDASSLLPIYYQPNWKAENGEDGRSKDQYGRSGRDCVIKVPCGTEIRRADDGEWVGEVVKEGERFPLLKGGRGGLGNRHFVTSTHQAPRECTPGTEGESGEYWLELKLISDAGLVGYPNAGKSTLIGCISEAHPKVASYPFTTLHPVIGAVTYDDYRKILVADIPGLIDGAHEGVGLGHDFLRHIERTRLLVMVIDMAGVDGRKPWEDFKNLRRELELYRPELVERPYIVIANKMDLPEAVENLKSFKRRTREKPIGISAQERRGIDEFKALLYERVFGHPMP